MVAIYQHDLFKFADHDVFQQINDKLTEMGKEPINFVDII